MREDFLESYRLLHITWNDPPHYGLIRDTNMTMQEWNNCVVSIKMTATGKMM
jgi:hypothetical protein